MKNTMNAPSLGFTLAVIAQICLMFGVAQAQTTLQRSVIAQGAVSASGGGYKLAATVGQAVIGTTRSSPLAGFFGFWYNADRIVLAVEGVDGPPPSLPRIEALYPNPAREDVMVSFALPQSAVICITLHDLLGRKLHQLEAGYRAAGRYTLRFPVSALAPGVYFILMNSDGVVGSSRLRVK